MPKSEKQDFYRNPQKTSVQHSLARTISHGYPQLWGRNEKKVCKMKNICSNCPESLNSEQEAAPVGVVSVGNMERMDVG